MSAAVGAERLGQRAGAVALDVEDRQLPRAEREDRVGDRRAGPARAQQHDAVRARAGQAALEGLLEAAGVGVVADPPAVPEHDRVDRAERRGLG